MEILELKTRPDIEQHKNLSGAFNQLNSLLSELRKKNLPDKIVNFINQGVEQINAISGSDKALRNQIKLVQTNTLELIEKELKIVPKNHHQNSWMALGMAVFGLPIGAAFAMSIDNMGLIGIGLPIGMVVGMAYGSGLDKKAAKEGRQLEVEIKH